MDLDDQLAALAAGDLDEATARALRARAAADPAVARRLARLERLEEVLRDWEAPAMGDDAVQRLTDRVDSALADLDDGPLRAREPAAAAPTALPDRTATPTGPDAAGARTDDARTDRAVVDLGAERERRRGVPTWATGAAVAAGLVAVVGIGVGTVFTGSSDDASTAADDSLAGEAMTESDEMADDEMADDEMADGEMAESEMAEEMAEESAPRNGTATMAAPRLEGVDLAEGELDRLVDEDPDDLGARPVPPTATTDSQGSDTTGGTASDGDTDQAQQDSGAVDDPVQRCTTVALERDTTASGSTTVELVATGTYGARDAVLVVLRSPGDARDTFEVLAYAPTDCSLLDRTTVRR